MALVTMALLTMALLTGPTYYDQVRKAICSAYFANAAKMKTVRTALVWLSQ